MVGTKEEIRVEIEKTPRKRTGQKRYSRELRAQVLAYSREQRQHGKPIQQVADELGMKAWTLARWHQQGRKVSGKPAFVEVSAAKLQSVATPTVFEVVCPGGFEVRVPAKFEASRLRELLTALEA